MEGDDSRFWLRGKNSLGGEDPCLQFYTFNMLQKGQYQILVSRNDHIQA
jgi:hypothetical protein